MTYPPGTRVRVTFDGVIGEMGWVVSEMSPEWLAANPDKVTVLLDEPADGGVVLDRDGDAWQRKDVHPGDTRSWGHQAPRIMASKWRTWDELVADLGPLTVIHAGGEK